MSLKASIPQELVKPVLICHKESFSSTLAGGTHGSIDMCLWPNIKAHAGFQAPSVPTHRPMSFQSPCWPLQASPSQIPISPLPLPLLTISLSCYSLCFSFAIHPSLADSPGHVQSAFLSLYSELFQMLLGTLSLFFSDNENLPLS